MIQIEQLRLGNWFESNEKYYQVQGIKPPGVIIADDNLNYYAPGFCNPIPLTPELLEKCGFANNGQGIFDHPTWGSYLYPRNGAYLVSHVEGVAVKHVHQLQNLFFALTGEVLTINLK